MKLLAVKKDRLPRSDQLTRIRALLRRLSGPAGNGEVYAWANPGDQAAVSSEAFGLIAGQGLLEPWGIEPDRAPVNVPENPAELMSCLWEVDQRTAVDTLVRIASKTQAYGVRGRYDEAKARGIFDALSGLLGYGTRWWVNTGTGGWNPVTRHTFDALVIGANNSVIVTVLARDDD